MDGMIWHWNFVQADDVTSFSDHISIPPTSTIAQAYISSDVDFTDPQSAIIGFTDCEFVDENGQHRENLDQVASFSRNNMIRVDFLATVENAGLNYLINLFFWPSVS